MFKLFITSFLQMFFHEVLAASVGTPLFHDHVTVLSTEDGTTVTEIDINDDYHYKVTIEKVVKGEAFKTDTAAPGD